MSKSAPARLTLPLFPLGSVLYPGLVLPLHIFEERYRQLVADLLAGPEPRQFGVIAIRHGRETGINGVSELYATGCTAVLQRAERHDDGQYDLVTVGAERFTLLGLRDADDRAGRDSSETDNGSETGKPGHYLSADVQLLPDDVGDEAEAAVVLPAVQRAFRSYLGLLAERGGAQITIPELPDEPVLMSYLVAAAVVADLPEKQRLLEEPDALSRLIAERRLLSREMQMLRALTATPAPDLRYAPYSEN
ncbi:MAG TPA: LON peptidase substrate-binding domain-containing protein [Streptosporangiaceae bacterium]|nr:LON peptidase substrate-binding domain-containing protein [Streptosporangiaceae bacterium]